MGGRGDPVSGGLVMVDVSLILNAVTAVSIAAGALFAVIESRDIKKGRRLGLALQAGLHWTTKEFEDAYCRVWRADASDAKELEKLARMQGEEGGDLATGRTP